MYGQFGAIQFLYNMQEMGTGGMMHHSFLRSPLSIPNHYQTGRILEASWMMWCSLLIVDICTSSQVAPTIVTAFMLTL